MQMVSLDDRQGEDECILLCRLGQFGCELDLMCSGQYGLWWPERWAWPRMPGCMNERRGGWQPITLVRKDTPAGFD